MEGIRNMEAFLMGEANVERLIESPEIPENKQVAYTIHTKPGTFELTYTFPEKI
jgi:hypothetical protein